MKTDSFSAQQSGSEKYSLSMDCNEQNKRLKIRDSWQGLALLLLLLGAVGLFWCVHLLVVLLAIVGMIVLHELGHYIAARSAGMKVTEFFVGFGPRLWSFRKGVADWLGLC